MMQGMGMGLGAPQSNFGSVWGQGAPMWGGARMPQPQGMGQGFGGGLYRGGWGRQRQQPMDDGGAMGAAGAPMPYGQPAPRPQQAPPADGGATGTQMSPFQHGGMTPPWMMGGMMGPQSAPQPPQAPAPYAQTPPEMYAHGDPAVAAPAPALAPGQAPTSYAGRVNGNAATLRPALRLLSGASR